MDRGVPPLAAITPEDINDESAPLAVRRAAGIVSESCPVIQRPSQSAPESRRRSRLSALRSTASLPRTHAAIGRYIELLDPGQIATAA